MQSDFGGKAKRVGSKHTRLSHHPLNFTGDAQNFLSRKLFGGAPRAKRRLRYHEARFPEDRTKRLAEVLSEGLPDSHLVRRSIGRHGGRAVELDSVVLEYNTHWQLAASVCRIGYKEQGACHTRTNIVRVHRALYHVEKHN